MHASMIRMKRGEGPRSWQPGSFESARRGMTEGRAVATITARSDRHGRRYHVARMAAATRPSLDPSGDEPDTSCSMRFQTLFEARWIFAVLIILLALCWFLMSWLWLLFFFLIGYTFFFFRDPERAVPAEPDVVVAAADGVVVEIVELEETEVVRETMRRVAIFLSVFDVHTNRAPIRWADHLPRTPQGTPPRRAQPGGFGEE